MTTNRLQTATPGAAAPSFRATLLDNLRTRRAERAARQQLERELATYRTSAELVDLSAMLYRYDDADTEPVRRILDKVRAA